MSKILFVTKSRLRCHLVICKAWPILKKFLWIGQKQQLWNEEKQLFELFLVGSYHIYKAEGAEQVILTDHNEFQQQKSDIASKFL